MRRVLLGVVILFGLFLIRETMKPKEDLQKMGIETPSIFEEKILNEKLEKEANDIKPSEEFAPSVSFLWQLPLYLFQVGWSIFEWGLDGMFIWELAKILQLYADPFIRKKNIFFIYFGLIAGYGLSFRR